jgi:hypothetical protein
MAKIVGQEDFVYVWTLGTPGVGDEQDKLVVIDVNPPTRISIPASGHSNSARPRLTICWLSCTPAPATT